MFVKLIFDQLERKGVMRMKKAMVFVLVALMAIGSVFAVTQGASKENTLGVGLNAGSNTGLILNYGMGKFDLEGIIGFGALNGGLDVEVAANFEIVDVARECNFPGKMPFTIGAEGYITTDFSNLFGLGVLAPFKLAYTFEDVPVSLFIKFAPGVVFYFAPEFSADFGFHAALGATYNFDL